MLAAGTAAASDPASVRLLPQPDIVPKLQAFPHVAAPEDAQTQRINKALIAANSRARQAAQDCRAQAEPARTDPDGSGWERTITVTMRGPRYLAMEASETWYCGTAYPNAANFALAYDLRTGAPLNWQRLLPKALVQSVALDNAGDGTRLGVVASPALSALYLRYAGVEHDCVAALHDTALQFMPWPDAQHDGIALAPSGLPHVIAACGPDAVIPLPEARRLGVSPTLLDAIESAHRMGLWGMGDGAATGPKH